MPDLLQQTSATNNILMRSNMCALYPSILALPREAFKGSGLLGVTGKYPLPFAQISITYSTVRGWRLE
jgi:hypothetical protein